ncbi:MAG: nitrate reductase molybdenum cofactor assembly chaperone [Ketobacteraceae bacterium]|nr:nitrate reductase molybdenum cofactor assembly chaperone [Ketobacteraceae bacterium]
MDILKIIAVLMDYPRQEVIDEAGAINEVISRAREISPAMRSCLQDFVRQMAARDIMDLQEGYGEHFDRGRSLSLLLFEHVHGESRDRGQAMVDLMDIYEKAGFEINRRELPDYIPMYLEFLSTRDEMEAREGLADVAHILGMLSARMKERNCEYACLLDALLMISGAQINEAALREKAANEERDDSLEAMDKIWEEEMVTFMGDQTGQGCPSASPEGHSRPVKLKQEVPTAVHWVQPESAARAVRGE